MIIYNLSNCVAPSWIGNFNEAPPNWREITPKELAQKTHFGSEIPRYVGHKQIHIHREERSFIPVIIFVYSDNIGVAFEVNYWGEGYYNRVPPPEPLVHLRLYTFSKCEHEYEEIKIANCLTEWRCKKCDYKRTVDSSD